MPCLFIHLTVLWKAGIFILMKSKLSNFSFMNESFFSVLNLRNLCLTFFCKCYSFRFYIQFNEAFWAHLCLWLSYESIFFLHRDISNSSSPVCWTDVSFSNLFLPLSEVHCQVCMDLLLNCLFYSSDLFVYLTLIPCSPNYHNFSISLEIRSCLCCSRSLEFSISIV